VSHWNLSVALTVYGCASALLYLTAVRRTRRPWPVHRTLCFLAGIGSVWVALESGIDAYDDGLLSVHMVQHLILLVVAPALLLGGRPTLLVLASAPAGTRRKLGTALISLRPLTHPLGCLLVFYLVVGGTHIPSFYDATLRHVALHDTEHALYLLGGLLLWWPVLGGDPAPSRRLNGFLQLGYIIAAMLPMEVIGAYLSRAPMLFYPPYGPAGHALGASPLVDQANAGAIMWVCGGVVMVAVVLWSSMHAMVQEERRLQAREAYESAAPAPGAVKPGGTR
jgi:putative copper resistance protein D